MRRDTAVCATLVTAFILGGMVLMISVPWLAAMLPTPSASVAAPARLSGRAIALTCARRANVDMAGLITLEQVQEMERCAERMMNLLR